MVQPGRMARRHPDRTANRTTGIRRPRPSAPRPSVHTSQSPSWAAMGVKPGQKSRPRRNSPTSSSEHMGRRWAEPPRTHCEPQMRQPSARPAESHIGGTQTFSPSPGYPYTDSGHFQPCDLWLQPIEPRTRRRGHPTFARLTSAQSAAEQTRPNVVAFVPVADRRAPPIRPDRRCAHCWFTPPPRTVMIVAILDDETPWCGRHLE
jgi:hypothetical protein